MDGDVVCSAGDMGLACDRRQFVRYNDAVHSIISGAQLFLAPVFQSIE
jgi:hypothetical protein